MNGVTQFVFFLLALVISFTFHEFSHALAAYYLGDMTAKLKGRLTLNPIAHLDPIGSIVFLVTQQIGWGKPVPINPANFKHPLRDSALTALAGPMSNFVLAFVLTLPLKYLSGVFPETLTLFLWMVFSVNVMLGIFNFFPLPPLDGSKILGLFVPERYAYKYDKFLQNGVKYFLVIILVDVFILGNFFNFSVFGYAMSFLFEKVKFLLLLGA